jgi:hypothetical protein
LYHVLLETLKGPVNKANDNAIKTSHFKIEVTFIPFIFAFLVQNKNGIDISTALRALNNDDYQKDTTSRPLITTQSNSIQWILLLSLPHSSGSPKIHFPAFTIDLLLISYYSKCMILVDIYNI